MKKLLAITLTLAMLAGLVSVAGLSATAETTDAQQACVTGATLTALNSAADAALLPTGQNLLAGLSKLSGSASQSSGNWSYLTDGKYQGINEPVKFKKDADGNWQYSNSQKLWINHTAGDTRWVSYLTQNPTAEALGYAQIGFDLGTKTNIDRVAIASSAEPSNTQASQSCFSDPNFDGAATSFGKQTRLHMADVYVSSDAATLYDDANKVISMDYLNGDISQHNNSLAPIAGIYDLDKAMQGQYVGFRFYVADNTTINGKTGKWGWYSQVRIAELGVFGEKIYDGFSIKDIADDASLPTSTLLNKGQAVKAWYAGSGVRLTAESFNSHTEKPGTYKSPNCMNNESSKNKIAGTGTTLLTDGKFSPAKKASYVVTADATTNGVANIPITFGENAGKYWQVCSDGTAFIDYSGVGTRFWPSQDGQWTFFDLGANQTSVEQIVLAGVQGIPAFTADTAPTSEAELNALLNTDSKANKKLGAVDVYVSDSLIDLFGATSVYGVHKLVDGTVVKDDTIKTVGDDSKTTKITIPAATSYANLITLDTPAKGRYVGLKLDPIVSRMYSEVAVYGTTPVTIYDTAAGDAALPSKEDNILGKAVAANFRYTTSNKDLTNGMLLGSMVDGTNDRQIQADGKTCLGQMLFAPGAGYTWITYDLETEYEVDSVWFSAADTAGSNSVGIYVGDKTAADIQAGNLEPDMLYDAVVGSGFKSDNQVLVSPSNTIKFDTALTGRYVTIRLEYCNNAGNQQNWATEFSATGSPVTINTAGGQLRNAEATDKFAVRFGFHMATDSIGYADAEHANGNYARAELGADSKTTINGKEVQVVDFGAVVSNQTGIEADGLTLEACAGSSTIKKVPANNLYAVKDGYITYTAVVKNIPAAAAERDLYARPYIQYMDGDDVVTIYGDMFATKVANYLK